MLTRLAALGIRAPKRVLGFAGLLLVLAAAYGISAASHLASGGFYDTQAQSWQARTTLDQTFHSGDPNLVLEITSPAGVDSPAARAAGERITATLRGEQYATGVVSYWSAPATAAKGLVSKDGRSGLVIARIVGDDNTAPKRGAAIYDPLVGEHDGVTVRVGGDIATIHTVNDLTTSDLAKSEMIAVPLTVIALIWVFGSFVASLLPLVVGLSSIVGTMAILRGLAGLTDVSIYALNMTTAMGLALAIDYSLFVVSRYREEVRAGADPDDAIHTTMRTAGRTVLFSALTVGLSLAAMLVFPMYFLRSFAYAGIAVVALATVAALLLLPAMLKVLGPRVDALDLRAFVRRRLGRPAPVAKPVEAVAEVTPGTSDSAAV
ncbi:MAG: MMPL family transporter [Actinobacteria bacterium]|nr:MMPL family transporter [Actinomycetota bacterium]